MKVPLIAALMFSVLFISCEQKTTKLKNETEAIFPKGELGPAENFAGKAWNFGLVANDSGYHQIRGQPRQTIKKGDVIKCPPNLPIQ